MEKLERNKAVRSDQKESSFLSINSLGELLSVIFIAFFFAYVIGSQEFADSTMMAQEEMNIESDKIAEEEAPIIIQKIEKQDEKVYLNTSPLEVEEKIPPITEKIEKIPFFPKAEKEDNVTKEVFARPHFPKAKARKALPTLEVAQPIEKIVPPTKKYTSVKVETLRQKAIPNLASVNLAKPEMTVKANFQPINTIIEDMTVIEEEEESTEIENSGIEELLTTTSYNSTDFKWAVNNYNQGIKKSAKFIDTPDGKASYSSTSAGIVLKINDLLDIDSSYGIFVEKSEDGEEYNSIGLINAARQGELFYFDAEQSFDDQHHYRFRSTNKAGEEFVFGKVSLIRRASIVPISSQLNATGAYSLTLESKSTQVISYEIEEAWGSLNAGTGKKQLVAGENTLSFDLAGEPGLYFLTLSTDNQSLDLLIEKPGISPDLSFYEQEVSGKQSFGAAQAIPPFMSQPTKLNFDFYLKNGNTLIFKAGEYNSEKVKIKKAKISPLPKTLQAHHSDETLWFTAASNISYLHQKVPVILEHNQQEIAAQINIFSSKNTIRPISHFSPDGDGTQDEWRIPGLESCPNTELMVFNDWGNLIYKTKNVTNENIWNGQQNGKDLPAGLYYYVLGQYGGWVQLER